MASQTLSAGAATAQTGLATGLQWQTASTAASATNLALPSAVVAVGGWLGMEMVVGPDGVTEVEVSPDPGWVSGNVVSGLQSTYGPHGRGWIDLSIATDLMETPAFGTNGSLDFKVIGTASGSCVGNGWFDTWVNPMVMVNAVFRDTWYGGFWTPAVTTYGRNGDSSPARLCWGPLNYTEELTLEISDRYTFDHIGVLPWYSGQGVQDLPTLRWFPEGHASRPPTPEPGRGTITQYVECIDGDGGTHVVTASTTNTLTPGTVWQFPDLLCPAGTVTGRFGADWTPAVPGAATEPLIPSTESDDWVKAIPSQYPQCLTQTCRLELRRVVGTSTTSCGSLAAECPDWYTDPQRSANYTCVWGPYDVALDRCSTFRDPGTVLPNTLHNADGTTTYVPWPALDLGSSPVARRIAQLVDRYGIDRGCAVLGEAIRGSDHSVSIPDAVLVCRASGVRQALIFAASTSELSPSTEWVVLALVESATGVEPAVLNPECDDLSSGCTPEGSIDAAAPDPEAEPQPAAAGAGIPPRSNCLNGPARSLLEDSMNVEGHRMATDYGQWGQRFKAIADQFNLSLVDRAHIWNVHEIRHAGPHPWNYHDWVYRNMQLVQDVAETYPEDLQQQVFLDLFDAYVVQVVVSDPTIVRAAYWKCYEEYRWR